MRDVPWGYRAILWVTVRTRSDAEGLNEDVHIEQHESEGWQRFFYAVSELEPEREACQHQEAEPERGEAERRQPAKTHKEAGSAQDLEVACWDSEPLDTKTVEVLHQRITTDAQGPVDQERHARDYDCEFE